MENNQIYTDLEQQPFVVSTPDDLITRMVMTDLSNRATVGKLKYNTTLEENNHDNFMNHLYEELLDAAQYCKKLIEQNIQVQNLIKHHSNDADLGEKIRMIYGKK